MFGLQTKGVIVGVVLGAVVAPRVIAMLANRKAKA